MDKKIERLIKLSIKAISALAALIASIAMLIESLK